MAKKTSKKSSANAVVEVKKVGVEQYASTGTTGNKMLDKAITIITKAGKTGLIAGLTTYYTMAEISEKELAQKVGFKDAKELAKEYFNYSDVTARQSINIGKRFVRYGKRPNGKGKISEYYTALTIDGQTVEIGDYVKKKDGSFDYIPFSTGQLIEFNTFADDAIIEKVLDIGLVNTSTTTKGMRALFKAVKELANNGIEITVDNVVELVNASQKLKLPMKDCIVNGALINPDSVELDSEEPKESKPEENSVPNDNTDAIMYLCGVLSETVEEMEDKDCEIDERLYNAFCGAVSAILTANPCNNAVFQMVEIINEIASEMPYDEIGDDDNEDDDNEDDDNEDDDNEDDDNEDDDNEDDDNEE